MPDDERAAERFDFGAVVFVETGKRESPGDTGDIVVCNTLDLSENGLQILLDQPIENGRIVRICLDIHGHDLIFVVAKVRWHRSEGTDVRHGLMLVDAADTDIEAWKLAVGELITEDVT